MAEPTIQRKVTWPMLAVGGSIFVAGGLWMVSVVSSFMPSHPARPVAARDTPQVYVYIANNGEQKQPPTVFQFPQPAQTQQMPTEWEPPQPHLRQPSLQRVQLPVYQPDQLPKEYGYRMPLAPEMQSYRDQFPNACKPQIWNPHCQSLGDEQWEEVDAVPGYLRLPSSEQWTKVGSYLCIQHTGYFGPQRTRCWQRS